MNTNNDKSVSLEQLLQTKESRRHELAALPVEEKVTILVQLQRISTDIARQSGRESQEPWDIKTAFS